MEETAEQRRLWCYREIVNNNYDFDIATINLSIKLHSIGGNDTCKEIGQFDKDLIDEANQLYECFSNQTYELGHRIYHLCKKIDSRYGCEKQIEKAKEEKDIYPDWYASIFQDKAFVVSNRIKSCTTEDAVKSCSDKLTEYEFKTLLAVKNFCVTIPDTERTKAFRDVVSKAWSDIQEAFKDFIEEEDDRSN